MDTLGRAAQLWPILVSAAQNQKLLSYQMIEQLTGLDKRGVRVPLGTIQAYCKAHGLPPLTAIVVKVETGLPGVGFTSTSDPMKIMAAQARAFVFHWAGRDVPRFVSP